MSVVNRYKLAALVTAAAVTLAGCSGGKEDTSATDTQVTTPTTRSTILPSTTATPATRTTTSGTGVGDPTNQELLDAYNAGKDELKTDIAGAKAEATASKDEAMKANQAAQAAKSSADSANSNAKKAKTNALIGAILAGVGTAAGVGFGIWNLNRSKDQGEQTRQLVQDAGDANIIATGATGAALSGQLSTQGVVTADIHDRQGKQIERDGTFQNKALPAIESAASESKAVNTKVTALTPTINETRDEQVAQGESLNNLHTKADNVDAKVAGLDAKVDGVKTAVDESKKSFDAAYGEFKVSSEALKKAQADLEAMKKDSSATAERLSNLEVSVSESAKRLEAATLTLNSMLESDFETIAQYDTLESSYKIMQSKQDASIVFGVARVGDKQSIIVSDKAELAEVAKKLSSIDRSEASEFVDMMIKTDLISARDLKAIVPPVAEAPKAEDTGVSADPKAEGVAKAPEALPSETADQRK